MNVFQSRKSIIEENSRAAVPFITTSEASSLFQLAPIRIQIFAAYSNNLISLMTFRIPFRSAESNRQFTSTLRNELDRWIVRHRLVLLAPRRSFVYDP